MNKQIRKLTIDDFEYVTAMETGIEEDYIINIYEDLMSPPHALFGLFIDHILVSFAGYTIYQKHFAMLGRLRSDLRYRGKGYATEVMDFIKMKACEQKEIKWIGANTQENNIGAQRVLQKIGFHPHQPLFGAMAERIDILLDTSDINDLWHPIEKLDRKKYWLQKEFINRQAIFPYECFYPFPALNTLFVDEEVNKWRFYENDSQSRFFIAKHDQKGEHFLQIIYPWSDLMDQRGLWETVHIVQQHFSQKLNERPNIWIDLTEKQVQTLPDDHPFTWSSPWILFGKSCS